MRIAKYMTFVLFILVVLLFIPSQVSAQFYESIEWKVFEMVNQERTSRGLPALQMDSKLRTIARGHSKDMGDNNWFDHDSYDGTTFFERLDNNGVTRYSSGENIAYNSSGSAHDAMYHDPHGWMNSKDGHRETILDLNPENTSERMNYKYTGIGVYRSSNGLYYFTQVFLGAASPPGTILEPPTPTQQGNLQVTIEPAGARDSGAQWRVTTGPDINWKNSGATLSNLPVGTYTVTFKGIPGWNAPSNVSVNVTANQTQTRTATYTQETTQTGSIRINIEPAGARSAGAQWRVTTGPDINWKDSGTTLSNLPVGTYTVTFKGIPGWNAPPNSTINVTANQTQVGTVIYTQQVTELRSFPGLYDSRDGVFHLHGYNPYRYGPRNSSWISIAGNWNGSGGDDIGLYDQRDGVFHLRGYNPFRYGPRNSNWIPLAGDWNNDGVSRIGLYDQRDGVFHLHGFLPFRYGPRNSNWIPIAGDWNGNGTSSIGLYDQRDGVFHLHGNSPFRYGPRNSSWIPIAGDWNGNGTSSIGLYDQRDGVFHMAGYQPYRFGPRNSNWSAVPGIWAW